MILDEFVRERRPVWNRFAALTEEVYARGVRRIPGVELNDWLYL